MFARDFPIGKPVYLSVYSKKEKKSTTLTTFYTFFGIIIMYLYTLKYTFYGIVYYVPVGTGRIYISEKASRGSSKHNTL